MIEIHPLLHVGSEHDYEEVVRQRPDWRVVHACKEPYHRQALGYTGRAAAKTHPEYLIARRDPRLILNLVDAPDPAYIHESRSRSSFATLGGPMLSIGDVRSLVRK